jgi:hypothetical protein
LWQNLVVFPATTFRAVRALPKPPLIMNLQSLSWEAYGHWARFYVPLLIYTSALAMIAVSVVRRYRRSDRGPVTTEDLGLLAVTLNGLGLFMQATGRYEKLHALPTTVPASLVLTGLLARIPKQVIRQVGVAIPLIVALGVLLASPYLLDFVRPALDVFKAWQPWGCYAKIPRASCVPLVPGQEWAASALKARTEPDAFVFVGNTRHDRIVVNDLALYFLAARPCPTRYGELHPGVATTRSVQQRIIADLVNRRVQWIVLAEVWNPSEPNASAVSSGVDILDAYIRTYFRPVAEEANYALWRRTPD